MVMYRMVFNPMNISLSETALFIYDSNKPTDYYWTNFSDVEKTATDILLSNLSVCDKRFGVSEV